LDADPPLSWPTFARRSTILTVVIQTPRTAEQLRKNPLGVFVNAIDWSRELDAAAPSLPKESVE
jgi:type IV secretion system protein VirB5